jgi:hypothetical protein
VSPRGQTPHPQPRSRRNHSGTAFDDLQLSHSDVKTTKQHETKVIGESVLDQALRQLQIGKLGPALPINAVELHFDRRISPAQLFQQHTS